MESIKLLESLMPIDDSFDGFIKGNMKSIGDGLYLCSIFNKDHARVGYAVYDNGTSIYNEEADWLGYCIEDSNPDVAVKCPHCGEVVYETDELYMENTPVSAPAYYNDLLSDHINSCWSNPNNPIKEWKKEAAIKLANPIHSMLIGLEVSRFTVKHYGRTYSVEGKELPLEPYR